MADSTSKCNFIVYKLYSKFWSLGISVGNRKADTFRGNGIAV